MILDPLMFQALTDADPKALEELGEWLRQVFNFINSLATSKQDDEKLFKSLDSMEDIIIH